MCGLEEVRSEEMFCGGESEWSRIELGEEVYESVSEMGKETERLGK